MLSALLHYVGESLAHSGGSLIPCRNECMTELKQRAQGIPQAGESKTDGGQSNYKGNNTASDVLPPSSQRAG